MSLLERARYHLEHGALVEALDALLAAWAQHEASEIAELIEALGSCLASALPPIEGKTAALHAPPPALAKDDEAVVAAIAKLIARAEKQAPDPRKLTTVDDGARLLAEVLGDPDNEAPRMVYMDWLQQRGDPRGEVMALAPDHERAVKLVKQHGTSWLGPLAAVVSEPEFERGFLSAGIVKLASKKQHELLQHPLWATVRRIECAERVVVESPAMKSLRAVRGLQIRDYAELAKRKDPVRIEAIEAFELDEEMNETSPEWRTVLGVGALANLKALGLRLDWRTMMRLGTDVVNWRWLLGSQLGKQLAKLHIDFSRTSPSIASWIPAFAGETLVLTVNSDRGTTDIGASAIVRRQGNQLAYTLELMRPIRPQTNEVRWELEEVPAVLFEDVTAPHLDVVVATKVTRRELGAVEKHFANLLGQQFETITVAMGPSHRAHRGQ